MIIHRFVRPRKLANTLYQARPELAETPSREFPPVLEKIRRGI
jgi:hypothetical protein